MAADAILPLNVVVALGVVNQFFPEVTRTASTGANSTAVGNPTATRSVIYANGDNSMKVTVTVDEYGSVGDASSAFQQALEASEAVPGFNPISVPNLGQQSFAGTVTQGGETHVGLGLLDGALVIGVTLAGYDANSGNLMGLVSVARTEDTTAKTALGIPLCFAAGTRIATPHGHCLVEQLRIGDTVMTVSGARQQVQWIGRRRVDCRRHAKADRVMPIRVAPHAFGDGRPGRTLWLSPDHSVFVEGVLIPVRFLINDDTIAQIEVNAITYYHIELPKHDVVLAEGLPVETYLETGGRDAFDNGGGATQLHPDFAPAEVRVAMMWDGFAFAPLIGDSARLELVRAKLRLQCELLRDSLPPVAREV
jgi:Hint domain-containing protein